MWEQEKIPNDWEKVVKFPIHKKGDNRECSIYRGISPVCPTAKIHEAILEKKQRKELEPRN